MTLARRGIAGDENREIQLGGEGSRENECRSNIGTDTECRNDPKRGKGRLLKGQSAVSPLYRRPREFFWNGFSSEDKRSAVEDS